MFFLLNLHNLLSSCVFIGFGAQLFWIAGVMKLFWKRKQLRPKNIDHSKILALHLLESLRSINFIDKQGDLITFKIDDAVTCDLAGKMKFGNCLEVKVDSSNKRSTETLLNNEPISAEDALSITFFQTITAQHVPLHAYGNWGSNIYKMFEIYFKQVELNFEVSL